MAMATFTPTAQQDAVISFFEAKFGPAQRDKLVSVFLNAVAGSGKTSTLMLVAEAAKAMEQRTGKNIKGCMVAFNKIIATTAQNKLKDIGSRLEAKTTNALGHAILNEAARTDMCPKPKLDTKKYYERVLNYVSARKFSFPAGRIPPKMISSINKLVSAARLTFTEPTEDNLLDIVDHYGLDIDITTNWAFIWQAVAPIIEEGVNEFLATGKIDFDDQIYLPLRLEYAAPMYDLLMIDEAQDLNSVRLKLIQSCVKNNGMLLFVGDPFQAIQGFAFADTHSIQTIKQETNAAELPLSVCWRCDNKIIEVAQALVPHIEARPGANDGIVDMVSSSLLIKALETGYKRSGSTKDGDLVLCRVNADLVRYCLDTIRAGKYAVIRGRSIGRGILAKIDEIIEKAGKPVTLANLSEAAQDWLALQINSLWGKKNAEDKIAKLEDQVDSIDAFVTGFLLDTPTGNIDQLRAYIEEKFSGDEGEGSEEQDGILPIIFSTVHKAKGLEFDRVFILRPDLMPHPMAKLDWQKEQEYNILYVACTRAKHELYFVDDIPECLKHVVEPMIAPEEMIDEEEAVAIAESIVTPVVEAPEIVEEPAVTPEPIIAEQPVEVAQPTYNYPYSDGKSRKGAAKTKGVAYNFPPELCDKLDQAAALILEKDGHKFDKSAYIAGVLVGAYPNIDELIASLQDQDNTPDPDDHGGAPLPATSEIVEGGSHFSSTLAHFFDMAIQDATSRGYTVQAVINTPQAATPIVASESHLETPMLFDAPIDPEKAYRRFYHCGSKFCKHKWGYDYRYDNERNEFYRLDANGKRISAEQDAICPKCGNDGKYAKKRTLRATYHPGHRCTASCKNATSDECTCVCGGSSHGEKWMQGVKLLKAPKK